MTPQQAAALLASIKELRRLQKLYFKQRNSLILAQCKKAEGELDQMILDIEKPEAKADLFSGNNNA